jgi:hypothetical protein
MLLQRLGVIGIFLILTYFPYRKNKTQLFGSDQRPHSRLLLNPSNNYDNGGRMVSKAMSVSLLPNFPRRKHS